MMNEVSEPNLLEGIAIIGMSGRFPGAKNLEQFWQNLQNGQESITFFTEAELQNSDIDPALLKHPHYVRAKGVLEDIEDFDAAFFGMNPREAEITDPQHRILLECAWEALENAGYTAENYDGSISVYAGAESGAGTYFLNNLFLNRNLRETVGEFSLSLANDKDFLATRISYKLNLKGQSLTVQTACSTSLVAICMACQSLLNYQCDMALAGGVSITVPKKAGYLYQEGMILSPDGHCRAFDAKAQGTVDGNGAGIVVLKRLEEAIAEGDFIHGVIIGLGLNNDGSFKVGFTAPSIDGQAEAISQALAMAEIPADTISYVEAHGTGTALGDPIEIAALTKAFRLSTQKKQFCAIGSVKTNLGHLSAAAGVTGLLKTLQSLKHQWLPPSLHFEAANPQIDFANSPFYVNAKLTPWPEGNTPRRAGVSSFGMGGTNAHVIVEEAPKIEPSDPSRSWQLLLISAKTPTALETATTNLITHFQHNPGLNFADVAYTLQVGRKAFNHRRMVVCQTLEEAIKELSSRDPKQVSTGLQVPETRSVVFMFSGQGSQYVNMGLELYQTESVFHSEINRCCELLKPHLKLDLRDILYPPNAQIEIATQQLKQTAITQPALFVIEYALGKLWMSWGVQPVAAIGHSLGEYVAACLAGVFSLEDALFLIAKRGELMQQLPSGTMLAIPLPEREVQPFLNEHLALAVVNGVSSCVVSGRTEAVELLHQQLAEKGIEGRRLQTSHAFHSPMMEPILEPFMQEVAKVKLNAPQFPYISNVTGTWITADEATTVKYWAQHLRQTVRFAAGLQPLLKEPNWVLLEIGPGRTLSTLAKQHPDKIATQTILSSLRHPQDVQSDVAFLLNGLGKLWIAGVPIQWSKFVAGETRHRLPLPTYPFERQRYWIDPIISSNFASVNPPLVFDLKTAESSIVELESELGKALSFVEYPSDFEAAACELCASYAYQFLQESKLDFSPGKEYTKTALKAALKIIPAFEKFYDFLITMLAEDEILQGAGETLKVLKSATEISSPQHLQAELAKHYPEFIKVFEILDYCVKHYPQALSGEIPAVSVLYPDGSFDLINSTIEASFLKFSNFPFFQKLATAIVDQIVENSPKKAALKFLEIGGGEGHLTWEITQILKDQKVEYIFTDLGKSLVMKAEQKARKQNLNFMRFGVLDISQDPVAQGYQALEFDVILAYNVIHATRNLTETFDQIKKILAPHGILLLIEASRLTRWETMVWGLAEAWWYFADPELRKTSPLLNADQWQAFLKKQGFQTVQVYPKHSEDRVKAGNSLILAQQVSSPLKISQKNTAKIQESSPTESSFGLYSRPNLQSTYVAPQNELEQQMAQIWQEILGIQQVGMNDDFFELGGDSLLAVQLMSKMRELLAVDLPKNSLLEAPTLASLKRLAAQQSPTEFEQPFSLPNQRSTPLVQIKAGGTQSPFFCVHPGGGNVMCYVHLARHLQADRPFYGLQAEGLDGRCLPLIQVEEMATHYLQAIQTLQPEGPYFLGGWSFGGVVAFEMAVQLQQQGQSVAFLGLIDIGAPNPAPPKKPLEDEAVFAWFAADLGRSAGKDLNLSLEVLRQKGPGDSFIYLLEQAQHLEILPATTTLDDIRPLVQVFHANLQALQRYQPTKFTGPITLFKATEPLDIVQAQELFPESSNALALGWENFSTTDVAVYPIPGNHYTLINAESQVRILAECLGKALEKAESLAHKVGED